MTPPSLRELLERERFGVLATLSVRAGGWPFASVAAYALARDSGDVLLLLSDLAEHTRNVRADGRASLLVQQSTGTDGDPQANARVTLLGTIEPLAQQDTQKATTAYLEKHSEAAGYFTLGDFRLYKMHVNAARFVNGFGDMGWLAADQVRAALAD